MELKCLKSNEWRTEAFDTKRRFYVNKNFSSGKLQCSYISFCDFEFVRPF